MDLDAVVIGLEVHVSLKSESKLFCNCFTGSSSHAVPNSNVCEVCTGQPGAKPMAVNATAFENAVKIGLALNCVFEEESVLQRKHYWYPDLPSGYQRTSAPIGRLGSLRGITITEAHIEEDPGRYDLKTGHVDYNRSGSPLLEVVTAPQLKSPQEARDFLDELQSILQYLDCAKEEAGSTRVDANISIKGSNRVEVKNINSFKGVFTALTYEITRQRNLLKNSMPVVQETRHFDEGRGITLSMRKKETVADYRYFPDPDIPPIAIKQAFLDATGKKLPELPTQKRARFQTQYKMREEEAFAICLEKEFADAFEESAKQCDAKILAPFCRGTVRKQLNYRDLSFKKSFLSPSVMVEIVEMISKKEITEKVGEELLIAFLDFKENPAAYAQKQGLLGIQTGNELEETANAVIKQNPKAVQDFFAGEEKAVHFLAGQIMKATQGKASPSQAQEILRKLLTK